MTTGADGKQLTRTPLSSLFMWLDTFFSRNSHRTPKTQAVLEKFFELDGQLAVDAAPPATVA